jgi:hypothetical protein
LVGRGKILLLCPSNWSTHRFDAWKVVTAKYTDLGIPIVDVYINNICIPNTLIDLGATINVMTRETMKKLKLTNLHQTSTVLQMVDRSTVEPEGILEDILSM